ncbi:MAG TPA: ectonucleotide pyrophosphatase/phosphodiesterase [Methylomirabilota bacterium]|nr:ectonucleotide pyrophosphatase/phosphodiesterase [Methylomirabilota bacterium]
MRPLCERVANVLFVFLCFVHASAEQPPVLLVSFDGFRADYLDAVATPNFIKFGRQGVRAKALVPPFPSDTFPSHYSMVTGHHPDEHGIVANVFRDPQSGDWFNFQDATSISSPKWWQIEPIWVTARRQGFRTATCFWPGSGVEIAGLRPNYWLPYDSNLPTDARIEQVIAWLQLPESQRPHFLTLYFSLVDKAGHEFGPASPQVREQIHLADQAVGSLMARLPNVDRINVIIVSDHGMAQLMPQKIIALSERLTESEAESLSKSDLAEDEQDRLLEKLQGLPHVRFYKRRELPRRLRYGANARIPSLVPILEEGATILWKKEDWDRFPMRGNHGYDNKHKSMHGIFLARGPSFRAKGTVGEISNINVYNVVSKVLGMQPLPNKGDPSVVNRIVGP